MNKSKNEIRKAIEKLVAKVKQVSFSFSTDGGATNTVLSGKEAVDKIEELIHKGEISSLVVKNKKGKDVVRVPLFAGMLGAVAVSLLSLPITLAAGATIVLTECEVVIETRKKK